jgi:hypothetical protein
MNVKELKQNEQTEQAAAPKEKVITGIVLVIIGIVALLGQFLAQFNLSHLILPGLGLGFLAWGILARQVGFLIPGGILSGIGLGVIVTQTGIGGEMGSEQSGALFLLSFAAGWLLITLLSAVFTTETQWWPLIPGGIMAAIGSALLIGDPALTVLEFAGRVWPVALIIIGVYLIWRRRIA